jgi:parallel beta-helix repeat protein
MSKVIITLTCLLLVFPASSWAAVYYVDIVNGNDGNDGTSPGTGAWKRLHYAVNQLSDWDVLNVAAGTYGMANNESDGSLTITQSNVIIQGAGGTSILDGSGYGGWNNGIEINASDVTIRGLAVRNFTGGSEAGIRVESGTGNVVEGCEIYDNNYGIVARDSSPEIRKNRLHDNIRGIYVYETGGTASPNVSNNLIYYTGTIWGTYGIYLNASTSGTVSPRIYHNTIDGGNAEGVYIYAYMGGSSSPEIKYNIITNFDTIGIYNDSGTPVIAYNDVWNNGSNYSFGLSAGPGDISVNPLYASYQLQSTSPCIDAIPLGEDDPLGYDIDGNPRPQEEGFDMGAYEQVASTVETVPIPPGTEIPEYIMVSFTVEPEDPACTSVFADDMGGAYDPENFRIGGYDPTLGRGEYRECDSGLVILPGYAYWILARDGLKATVDGIPTSLSDTEVPLLYSAATGNGWNQIGCPNNARYAWVDVEVVAYDSGGAVVFGPMCIFDVPDPNPYIDKRLWRWVNGSYASDTTDLVAGEGYWVQAKTTNVSLIFRQSMQLAELSNTAIMFADLWSGAKRWAKRWVFGPQAAIADSGDTPPMPMEGIATPVSEDGGGSGCLINTTTRGVLSR